MSKPWRTILGAVAIGAMMPAWAVDRPAVTIAFDLNVPRWQGQFGARRDELQAKVAAAVAAWMSQQMGFADFGAGTGGPQRLVLHLDVASDAGAHEFKETQLRLELAGAAAATPLIWRFRSDERYAEPTGGVDAFAQEVALRLVDVDKQALVRQVLSRVPIASEAALWKDPVGWVIPFRKTDLCMDFICPRCGGQSHFDGMFAYVIQCPHCEAYFRMPQDVAVEHLPDFKTTDSAFLVGDP